MTYRSAVLGCGPRSLHHAAAYEMRLEAACDLDRRRLDDYGQKFGIKRLYEDLETMLETERPDVLHIVTPPGIREEPMELAGRYGVKGVLVEKPLALVPSQARKIEAVALGSGMKIAVNTQRPYFDTCRGLVKVIEEKRIGEVGFVRCVTKGNILSMGPHMLDLVTFFLGGAFPDTVWACARGWSGEEYGHPAPENMLVRYTYPGGLVVYLEEAADCIGTPGETEFWQHFELDFWASAGRAWWTQNRDWGYQAEGMDGAFTAKSRWAEDEAPGQREFTRAMAHWLDDDRNVHVNCLESALKHFNAAMGAMLSAVTGEKVDLPAAVDDEVVARLKKELTK